MVGHKKARRFNGTGYARCTTSARSCAATALATGFDGTPSTDDVAEYSSGRFFLTTYDTDSDVVPAIEAGATGYLLKDSPRDELLRAVRAAARGESVLSPAVETRLLGQVRGQARGPAQVPLSGMSSLTGYADWPPMHVGISYGDPTGGLHGAVAVLAAVSLFS